MDVSVYLAVDPSIHPPIHPSMHLSIYPSIDYQSIVLLIYRSVDLSVLESSCTQVFTSTYIYTCVCAHRTIQTIRTRDISTNSNVQTWSNKIVPYIYIYVYMFNIKWQVLCMFPPFSSDIGISTHLGLQGAIPCEQWLPNRKCYSIHCWLVKHGIPNSGISIIPIYRVVLHPLC